MSKLSTKKAIKNWKRKNTTKNTLYTRRWRDKNRDKYNASCRESHKKNRRTLKELVMAVYGGGKCSCCGETELSFLTLDHIEGGGGKQRKELGRTKGSGVGFYKWLVENGYPDGLQVLCANCNLSKHINGGVCAHKLPNGGK